jgi:hypothetical protein
MRPNRLEVPLGSSRNFANSLEVFVGAPASGQGRESNIENLRGGHLASEADE